MRFNIVTDLKDSFNPYPKSQQKLQKTVEKSAEIKKKSSKLAKKERKRFSILQNRKECYLCKTKENLDKHEAFGGCRRQKSMEYGLVYYLCRRCHTEVENNENMKKQLKLLARAKFNTKYSPDLFLKEFGKDC